MTKLYFAVGILALTVWAQEKAPPLTRPVQTAPTATSSPVKAVPAPPSPHVITDLEQAQLQVGQLEASNLSLQAELEGARSRISNLERTISNLRQGPVFAAICKAAGIDYLAGECAPTKDGKGVERKAKQ